MASRDAGQRGWQHAWGVPSRAEKWRCISFYVAAVVKPLFPFFPSLASFLEGLCHIVLISLLARVLVLRRPGMARRVRTSQSGGHPYHHPWLNPDAPGHLTSMCLAASLGVGT